MSAVGKPQSSTGEQNEIARQLLQLVQLKAGLRKQLQEVDREISQLQTKSPLYISFEEAVDSSSRIFEENVELFRKLAQ